MILDPCAGSRMFWFDKSRDDVIFGDLRVESHTLCDGRGLEIKPTTQMDFTALPFARDTFDLVVLDPPHLRNVGPSSWMAKKYGILSGDWTTMLRHGFGECFRVLKPGHFLIFKWNDDQIPVSKILALTDRKPLFGHKSGRNSKTHWITFIKS